MPDKKVAQRPNYSHTGETSSPNLAALCQTYTLTIHGVFVIHLPKKLCLLDIGWLETHFSISEPIS